MQGSIIQSIALVFAINARIRGIPVPKFWPEATAFNFCRYVRFLDGQQSGLFRKKHKVLAADPEIWVERAASRRLGARIHSVARNDPNISDRNAAGFVGGGARWLVELAGERSSELWEDSWQVVDQEAADRRIWGVRYFRIADEWAGAPEAGRPLEDILAEVEAAIGQTLEFARANAPGWVEFYERAHEVIRDPNNAGPPYHDDIIPRGLLKPDAEHLLIAAQSAWAFGGMGSWNDLWFEGEVGDRYDALSNRLYSALVEAAAAATNASFGSG